MVQSSELTVRMEDGEPKMHCGACGLYLTRAATRDICGVGEHLTGPPHLAAMERKKAKNAKTVRLAAAAHAHVHISIVARWALALSFVGYFIARWV